MTALAGQVLRLNGQPLANVTIRVGYRSARTDTTGRFLVTNLHAGYPTMHIEGATANRPGRTYGHFAVGVDIDAGQTNVLPYTIWMPLIDTAHATRLPVPTRREVVATTPRIPGLEVHVPPGRGAADCGRPVDEHHADAHSGGSAALPAAGGGEVLVHAADAQRAGAAAGRQPEPDGRAVHPAERRAARAGHAHRSVDVRHDRRAGTATARATVSRDGTQIVPDPGVEFHEVTCFFYLGPILDIIASIINGVRAGDPVDLATGLFVYEKTDLVVDDVLPIVISRHYRQGDTKQGVRAFGLNTQLGYQMFLTGRQFDVHLRGAEPGGRRPGAVHADLERDGVRGRRDGAHGDADAVLQGAADVEPGARVGDRAQGRDGVRVRGGQPGVAADGDPGPGGQPADDRRYGPHNLLISRITSPNGRWVEFTWDPGGQWYITQVRDNAGRTVNYTYTAGRLTSVTDANGGVTSYTYNTNHQMLTVTDPEEPHVPDEHVRGGDAARRGSRARRRRTGRRTSSRTRWTGRGRSPRRT